MEIRQSIPHLSNYDITPDGRVFNSDKELKQQRDSKDYNVVTLVTDFDGRATFKVHRLVAAAYIHNPDPDVFNTVNHKDGNKRNNDALNLEWCTNLQNIRHAIETGLIVNSRPGIQNGRALVNDDIVRQMREEHVPFKNTYRDLANKFSISERQVSKIVRKEAWAHVE